MTHPISDSTWAWDDLDHSRAAEVVSPHLTDASPAALDEIGRGDFCLAFSWGSRVVRVARHRDAGEALRREACVLGKIGSRLPLTVPRPAFHAPHGCPPFAVHEAVGGEVLTRAAWAHMPPAIRNNVVRQLAEFLSALHAQPVDVAVACRVPVLDSVEMARELHELTSHTIRSSLSNHAWRQLDHVLARWSERPPEKELEALLHGDIAPGHLLYDSKVGSLTGVIDFGDVAIGHPARDFIYLYEDFGPLLLDAVVEAYAGGDVRSLSSDIRKWYLLEAVSWTVERWVAGNEPDTEHGLREITWELSESTSLA